MVNYIPQTQWPHSLRISMQSHDRTLKLLLVFSHAQANKIIENIGNTVTELCIPVVLPTTKIVFPRISLASSGSIITYLKSQ